MINYSETEIASSKLFEELKCGSCKRIPFEPFTTGVCDHILCKECIFKSNNCPKCETYYRNDDILMIGAIQDMIKSVTDLLNIFQPIENDINEREAKKIKIDSEIMEIHEHEIMEKPSIDQMNSCCKSDNEKTDYIIINEDSNEDDYQSILERNLCNTADVKLERPNNLNLGNNITKKLENQDILEIVDEDSVPVETKTEVMLCDADSLHDCFEDVSTKQAPTVIIENKNKAGEQNALDLFMSFCEKHNSQNDNKNDNDIIEIDNQEQKTVVNNIINQEHTNNFVLNENTTNNDFINKNPLIEREHIGNEKFPEDVSKNNLSTFESIKLDLSNPNKTIIETNVKEKPLNESIDVPINNTNDKQERENEFPATAKRRNSKRVNNNQNKTVIFKPETNKKKDLDLDKETSILDISGIKLEDHEKPIAKPRGRGRKPKAEKIEVEALPTQTQGDGIKKRLKKNDKGETPLHIAVMDGDYEACKILLAQNMDPSLIDHTDNAGWTPLHEACGNGYIEIVRLLIEKNANINSKGFKDSTPLHEAILNNHVDCAKVLLESGCDVTIKNSHGFLAKDFLKNCKNGTSLIKLFEKLELNNVTTAAVKQETIEIPSTNQNKTRGKRGIQKAKIVTIYSTGMNEEEKVKLAEMSKKLNFKFVREMSTNVTHVVFKDARNNKTCQRTINYMKAVLMGLWIVSVKWIEDSLIAGHLLEEHEYEAKGSHKAPISNSPFKGRMNACYENPNLFDDFFFFLYGDFQVFEKNDLTQLIKIGGGTVLRREPKLERLDELMTKLPFHADKATNLKCTHFIIYDVNKPREIIRNDYLNTLNVNFIFNCIDEFIVKVDENTK